MGAVNPTLLLSAPRLNPPSRPFVCERRLFRPQSLLPAYAGPGVPGQSWSWPLPRQRGLASTQLLTRSCFYLRTNKPPRLQAPEGMVEAIADLGLPAGFFDPV